MTRIKICGLTCTEQAIAASDAGADFLGLVFAPSRRRVSIDMAAEISKVVHSQKHPAKVVGVFVNLSAQEINRVVETCQLDWVQLSGDEAWEHCRNINIPVIKTVHVSEESDTRDILNQIDEGFSAITEDKLKILLDTRVGKAYGGTGQTFRWEIARAIAKRFPVIIAGGLTPENILNLVENVKPWGVDVSSGVETDGRKDILKMRSFILNVKSRDRSK